MLIALIILIAGGIVMYQRGFFNGTTPADTTNINVTIPAPALLNKSGLIRLLCPRRTSFGV